MARSIALHHCMSLRLDVFSDGMEIYLLCIVLYYKYKEFSSSHGYSMPTITCVDTGTHLTLASSGVMERMYQGRQRV